MVAVGLTASLLGPLDYMFGETLRVSIATAVVLGLGMALVARFNAWSFERAAKNWLLLTSLVAIFLFTQHSPYYGHGRIFELSPFADFRASRINEHRRDLVLANIALFMPFGIAVAWRGWRFAKMLGVALCLSIMAETLQFVSAHGRVAQTADVLLNTSGAVIAWVVTVAVLWTVKPPRLEGERGVTGQVQRRTRQHA
jgi:glycopeptide antibiotics resistance protein